MIRNHPFAATITLLAALVVCAAVSVRHASLRRAGADEQRLMTQECRRLIQQIQWLREQPNQADAGEMQIEELTAAIEQAADQASLDRQRLVRIWPEPPRRLGESPYLQKPTQVLVRNVSLEQITRLMLNLEQSSQGLRITALRMTAPPEPAPSELWTCEVTIGYLIYAPAARPTLVERS